MYWLLFDDKWSPINKRGDDDGSENNDNRVYDGDAIETNE